MNMLDPTAIADPSDYGPEDIKRPVCQALQKGHTEPGGRGFQGQKDPHPGLPGFPGRRGGLLMPGRPGAQPEGRPEHR